MKKIKNFLNKRSKLALLVFLVSIVIGILLIIELTNYSKNISFIDLGTTDTELANSYDNATILQVSGSLELLNFNILYCSILVFICLFNIVGYLYNKSEFMFISTGLYVFSFCLGLYVFDIPGVIFIACLFLLNVLGYVDQVKLTDKKKKKA